MTSKSLGSWEAAVTFLEIKPAVTKLGSPKVFIDLEIVFKVVF